MILHSRLPSVEYHLQRDAYDIDSFHIFEKNGVTFWSNSENTQGRYETFINLFQQETYSYIDSVVDKHIKELVDDFPVPPVIYNGLFPFDSKFHERLHKR